YVLECYGRYKKSPSKRPRTPTTINKNTATEAWELVAEMDGTKLKRIVAKSPYRPLANRCDGRLPGTSEKCPAQRSVLKEGQNMSGKASETTVAAVIALLAETFPKCFSVYQPRRRPLKLKIHLDIQAALDGAITPLELHKALGIYCSNPSARTLRPRRRRA